MRQERCVCGKENAQQFVRRTIHGLWHMLSECESRIGEMQERARIEKKCKKNSRKTPRWCCRLGVFDVHWCSANVFVFRRTHSAHRKHKMYLPTMALNWLKVVHNYNYITREWISEQTRSSERAREKRKNQHVSISERFIHQASNSCAHRNRVMRWFRTGVPLTIRELTHRFFFLLLFFQQHVRRKKNRTTQHQNDLQLYSHFVRVSYGTQFGMYIGCVVLNAVRDYDCNRSPSKASRDLFMFILSTYFFYVYISIRAKVKENPQCHM